MNIIIPTLGKERQKTYSPFLPICPDTGVVLEIPVSELDRKNSKIIFNNNGKKLEQSILDGNCKLQWKVDWAMRWYALDVDFEMYGKDLKIGENQTVTIIPKRYYFPRVRNLPNKVSCLDETGEIDCDF